MKGLRPKSIFLDILFTILTFGLFNLWIQIRQIVDSNEILEKDEFSFFKMALLTIITLGFYFVWHEYKMTKLLHQKVYANEPGSSDVAALISAVATFLGLWFLVDSYQQYLINSIIERHGSL